METRLYSDPKFLASQNVLAHMLEQNKLDAKLAKSKIGIGAGKRKQKKNRRPSKGYCSKCPKIARELVQLCALPKTDMTLRPVLLSSLSQKMGAAGRATFFKDGTQIFTFRLYATPAQVTSGVGGTIVTTFEVRLGNLIDNAALASIFDEFRIVRGKVKHIPYACNTYDSSATGAVPAAMNLSMDYDSNAAVASYTANERDNTVHTCTNQKAAVMFLPIGQPDLVWETTATTTTVKATAKWYADRCTISATYARIFAWFDVEFRCVQ